MSFGTRVYHILMSSLAVLVLANCGNGESKSAAADVSVIPPKPIVITADTVDENDSKISGPWFDFRLTMANNTTDKITIVAVTADVIGQNTGGQSETKTVAFSPSQFNFKLGEDTECKFTSFGTWAVGEDKGLSLTNAIPNCARTPVFIVGGNSTGVSGRNYRYRVQARPLGWFGTIDEATDRFEKVKTFFTQ